MEKRVGELTERDIRFLKNLDSQLRKETLHYDPNARPGFENHISEDFSERQITEREMKRILGISRKDNAVLYPTTTQFGFATAFGIERVDLIALGVEPVRELLLRCRESQLPEGYNFENLSEYFMEEMNLRTATVAGIRITNDLVDYVY